MLTNLIKQLQQTADAYRLGHEVNASKQYRICIEQLQQLAVNIEQQSQLNTIISQLLSCQERHDLIGLADTIEYQLCPLLLAQPLKHSPALSR
ncbi:hypothetical protein [Shewanella marina]|uniref:hypothetical protein n=1 Tax=Shewanella marina TaxID=487319 RepID=UPI0004707B3F|nr:hypothetical protein [Shewanella marina]